MDKTKFFNQTFKMLLSLTVCLWAIYFLLVAFVSESQGCTVGADWLVTTGAWAAGISSAPPLIYGLARFIFWPKGPRGGAAVLGGWVLSFGAGIFVTCAILFALAISNYGCR